MRITAPGWVGIGTTAPRGALDIFMTGTSSALIVPRDTTANRPATGFQINGMIRYNTTSNKFEAYENGAWANMIDGASQWTTAGTDIYYNSGNVGIGTTTPAARIDVNAGADDGLRITTTNETPYSVMMNNQTFGSTDAKGFGLWQSNAGFGVLTANNINTLSITPLGGVSIGSGYYATDPGAGSLIVSSKVGIGTTSPTAALNIQGTGSSNYQGIKVQNTFADATAKGAVNILGARYTNANTAFTGLGTWDDNANRILYLGGGGWNTPDATMISFYTAAAYNETVNNAIERMRITSAGNVGIGTTAPQATLHVNGTILSNSPSSTVYVDPTATDDSKDGLSAANAKKTLAAAISTAGALSSNVITIQISNSSSGTRAALGGSLNLPSGKSIWIGPSAGICYLNWNGTLGITGAGFLGTNCDILLNATMFAQARPSHFTFGYLTGGQAGVALTFNANNLAIYNNEWAPGEFRMDFAYTYGVQNVKVTGGVTGSKLSNNFLGSGKFIVSSWEGPAAQIDTANINTSGTTWEQWAGTKTSFPGQVHIGTTTPAANVMTNIVSSDNLGGSFNYPLQLNNSNAGGGSLNFTLFHATNGSAVAGDAMIQNGVGNLIITPNVASKDIRLTAGLWTNSPSITIKDGGNVGIGTTTPASKLDVAGEVKFGNTSSTCNSTNEGQQRYNSTSKAMEFCNGTSWMAYGAFRSSCPSGFTLIGTSGTAEAFCISSSQETSASWLTAATNCYNKSPKAHLCSTTEWVMACVAGASGPNNMTGHNEWTADQNYAGGGGVIGMTACNDWSGVSNLNNNNGSRCCFR